MSPRPYSRLTTDALKLLSVQVRLARKQRGMTELELAERAGIARSTLQLIEKAIQGWISAWFLKQPPWRASHCS